MSGQSQVLTDAWLTPRMKFLSGRGSFSHHCPAHHLALVNCHMLDTHSNALHISLKPSR